MATLIRYTPLSGQSTMVMEANFKSEQALKDYLQQEEKKKQEQKKTVKNLFHEIIQKVGGRRLTVAEAVSKLKWETPTRKEVKESIGTLDKSWKDVKIDDLYVILDDGNGEPKDVIDSKILLSCREGALEVLNNDPLTSMLARGQHGDRLKALWTAIQWLFHSMRSMRICDAMRHDMGFKFGRIAATGVSIEDMWSIVLRHHNGFVKTFWEVYAFGNKTKKTKAKQDKTKTPADKTERTQETQTSTQTNKRKSPEPSSIDKTQVSTERPAKRIRRQTDFNNDEDD